jgi:exodeoxyribonuclease VII large subunit
MFRSYAGKLPFEPEDGAEILARGRISLYEQGGQYQLYAYELVPLGQGALALAFEQLKSKLAREGLFAQERKKPLPLFPKRIGIVSSPTGAAIRDLISVITRRWPVARLLLAPALVQGPLAAPSIVRALGLLQEQGGVELIIIARGGGSLEDLWPFNEESVARAIYACPLPVISAVGHEVDFTIADFVADLRAPTPSAAGELAAPDITELRAKLRDAYARLGYGLAGKVRFAKKRLAAAASARIFRRKEELAAQKQLRTDELARALEQAMGEKIKNADHSLKMFSAALTQLSPLKTLSRGYSICRRDDEVITDASKLKVGDALELILGQGRANCTVESLPGDIDRKSLKD